MMNQFDNRQANDGKKRIDMPANFEKKPKTGFPMRKVIIFIIIAFLLAFYVFLVYKSDEKIAISKNEWMSMLGNRFGIEYTDDYGEDDATGEYVAITTMRAFSSTRLEHMTEDDINSDEVLIELADQYEIISKHQTNQSLSENEAKDVVDKAVEVYSSYEYFPVYEESVLKDNIYTTENWDITPLGDDYSSVEVKTDGDIPEVDQILIVVNDENDACAAKITECHSEGDKYSLALEPVSDLSDVYEVLSYSGVSDFSTYGANLTTETSQIGEDVLDELLNVVSPAKAYAANPVDYEITKSEAPKTDIKAEVSAQTGEGLSVSLTANDVEIAETSGLFKSDKEKEESNISTSGSITGSIELQDFCVCSSAYLDLNDLGNPENYANVTINTNAVFDLDIQGNMEGKYPLGTIHVPIVEAVVIVPVEIIGVDITPYLVISADGEIELTYTINNIYTGAEVTTKGPSIIPLMHDEPILDINAEVSASVGIDTVASIQALKIDAMPVIDPSITVAATAHATLLDKKDGFEELPPCTDLSAHGPVITMKVMETEDSAIYKVLDFLSVSYENEIVILSEEDTMTLLQIHIEWDESGNITKIDGDETNCTHIKQETIEDKLNDKVDDMADEAENMMQSMAEEWLNNLLMESCGGCY